MKLSDYVDQARGRQTELAVALNIPPQLVWQWSRGIRRVPTERCPQIERLTAGMVRCEELRPDVEWQVLRGTHGPGPIALQGETKALACPSQG